MPTAYILENAMAKLTTSDGSFIAPIAAAAAPFLVARGADQILIPAPTEDERQNAERAISLLPPERRSQVRLVDTDGRVLERVSKFVEPLWFDRPERLVFLMNSSNDHGFIDSASIEAFLYHLALAEKYRAHVAHQDLGDVRDTLTNTSPTEIVGEARFRFAEVMRVGVRYEPALSQFGAFREEHIAGSNSDAIWSMMDSAEYRRVVVELGRVGYLKKPGLGLRRLALAFLRFARTPLAARVLRLAKTSAEVATPGMPVELLQDLAGVAKSRNDTDRSFSPIFVDMMPIAATVALVAVTEAHGLPGGASFEEIQVDYKRGWKLFAVRRDARASTWGSPASKSTPEERLQQEKAKLRNCRRKLERFY